MLKGFLETQDEIPWDAILQVTGIINYGGRVTDANDLTCLMTTLEKYCSAASLADSYRYAPALPNTYYAPADCKLEGYREYINGLPLADHTEVFGLHGNANIAQQNAEANRLL